MIHFDANNELPKKAYMSQLGKQEIREAFKVFQERYQRAYLNFYTLDIK